MKSEQEIREMLTERLGVGFTCDPQGDTSRRRNRIEKELLLDILEVEEPLCSGCAIGRRTMTTSWRSTPTGIKK